jgi:penicillin-binding protein 2
LAGLGEGVITASLSNTILCTGVYTKVSNQPKCWIFTQNGGAHGAENVVDAIKDSCNCYFYEVGYRLGSTGDGLSNDLGLGKLAKYAEMFGFGENTGLEIEESAPQISDETIVPSAIGQGSHNYTVSQIARYVTTLANDGTCYSLSLLDKVTDSNGNLVEQYGSKVYNTLDVPQEHMNIVQAGMNAYAMNSTVLNNLGLNIAGKTGTAEQSSNHPNHALFIGYAPYESPEIAVAVRIANGYTSANAASIAADIYKYHFELVEEDELLSGEASAVAGTVIGD